MTSKQLRSAVHALRTAANAPDRLDRMERALRAVLERHRPEPFEDEPTEAFCVECQRSQMNGIYPCPTVTAIQEALG